MTQSDTDKFLGTEKLPCCIGSTRPRACLPSTVGGAQFATQFLAADANQMWFIVNYMQEGFIVSSGEAAPVMNRLARYDLDRGSATVVPSRLDSRGYQRPRRLPRPYRARRLACAPGLREGFGLPGPADREVPSAGMGIDWDNVTGYGAPNVSSLGAAHGWYWFAVFRLGDVLSEETVHGLPFENKVAVTVTGLSSPRPQPTLRGRPPSIQRGKVAEARTLWCYMFHR